MNINIIFEFNRMHFLSLLEPQDGVKISLDCAQIAFIATDKLVLSLRGGELFVLTLCADSLRYVRSFHFSKAASSVLTCCVSVRKPFFISAKLPKILSLILTFIILIQCFRCAFAEKNTYFWVHDLEIHFWFDSPKKSKIQLSQ